MHVLGDTAWYRNWHGGKTMFKKYRKTLSRGDQVAYYLMLIGVCLLVVDWVWMS